MGATPAETRNCRTTRVPSSSDPSVLSNLPSVLSVISACRFWLTLFVTTRSSPNGGETCEASTVRPGGSRLNRFDGNRMKCDRRLLRREKVTGIHRHAMLRPRFAADLYPTRQQHSP